MNIATLVPPAEILPDGGFYDFKIGKAQFEKFPYAAWTMENRVADHVRRRVREAGYVVRVRYSNAWTVHAMELVCTSPLGFALSAHPADFERVAEIITKGAVDNGEEQPISGRNPVDFEKGARTCHLYQRCIRYRYIDL